MNAYESLLRHGAQCECERFFKSLVFSLVFFAFCYIWFGFYRFTPGKASRSRIIKSDTQGGIATKIHQYAGAIIGESPLLFFPFESSVCKQKKPISRYLFPLPPICSPPSLPPPPFALPLTSINNYEALTREGIVSEEEGLQFLLLYFLAKKRAEGV